MARTMLTASSQRAKKLRKAKAEKVAEPEEVVAAEPEPEAVLVPAAPKKAKQAAVMKAPVAKQAPLKKKAAPKKKTAAAPVDPPRRSTRVPNLNAGFDLSKVKFSGGAIAVLGMVAVGAAETRNLNMSGF